MKENLYVIYDVLAEESGPIFSAKKHEVAQRKTVDALVTQFKGSLVANDFKLYHIGYIDTEKPCVESLKDGKIEIALDLPKPEKDIQRLMFENAYPKKEVINNELV